MHFETLNPSWHQKLASGPRRPRMAVQKKKEGGGGKGKGNLGFVEPLLQVTPTSSEVAVGCCPSGMNYVSSATKVLHNYLCARRLWRMAACLSKGVCLDFLRVSLAGPDGLAEAGSLPPPSTGRSNTVANVMCNKTHFYCSPPGGQ